MKKYLVSLLMVALIATTAYASKRTVQNVVTSARSADIAIATTLTVYSRSFPIADISDDEDMVVFFSGTPATGDVTIWYEESFDVPSTEGSADTDYLRTTNINSFGGSTNMNISTIGTVNGLFGRFGFTGKGSNPLTTVINMKVVK